jgi:hypothetical protein
MTLDNFVSFAEDTTLSVESIRQRSAAGHPMELARA